MNGLDTISGNANKIASITWDLSQSSHHMTILAITAVIMGAIIIFLAIKVLDLYFDMEVALEKLDGLEEVNEELRGFIKNALVGPYESPNEDEEKIPDAEFKVTLAERNKKIEEKFIASRTGVERKTGYVENLPLKKPIIEDGSVADDKRTAAKKDRDVLEKEIATILVERKKKSLEKKYGITEKKIDEKSNMVRPYVKGKFNSVGREG